MNKKGKSVWISLFTGVVVGAVNGFFGGGGGMLVVPLLERGLKKDTKTAHATAILIILPISLFSALVYIFKGHFNWFSGGITGIGVVAGGALGALLLSKLSGRVIRIVFHLVMIAAGVKLMFF